MKNGIKRICFFLLDLIFSLLLAGSACALPILWVFSLDSRENVPSATTLGVFLVLLIWGSYKAHCYAKKGWRNRFTPTIDPMALTPVEYEYYVARHLSQNGYNEVKVTKSTGDYGVDVIGVDGRSKQKIAIQCKRYHGRVGVAAVQEVIAGKEYYGCDLAAVYTTGSYTHQAVEMAEKTHVKLYVLNKDGLKVVN